MVLVSVIPAIKHRHLYDTKKVKIGYKHCLIMFLIRWIIFIKSFKGLSNFGL